MCYPSVLSGSDTSIINACFKVGEDDTGTWIIYELGLFGSVIPQYTSDGTLIYGYKADKTTGDFIMMFGDSGNIKLTDIDEIVIEDKKYGYEEVALWDDTLKAYTFTDLDYVTDISKEYDTNGEFDLCIKVFYMPDTFIFYIFDGIYTGD
jgi:hypothetical protein